MVLRSNYVDKTGQISLLNKIIDTKYRFVLVTRARRFGKSVTANTLNAYYSKGCNSKELFSNLEIAKDPDFETYLNKYDVISIDMQSFEPIPGTNGSFIQCFNRKLTSELIKHYPDSFADKNELYLNEALPKTGRKFIFIIDEWDFPINKYKDDASFVKKYLNLLRTLFKETSCANHISLVYMTGILPLSQFDSQSSLKIFTEISMINQGPFAKYYGYTERDVEKLCIENDLDPDKTSVWYKGYKFLEKTVYNPFAISRLIQSRAFLPYWSQTSTCNYIKQAIVKDYDNLHEDLIRLCSGDKISNIDLFRMNKQNTLLDNRKAIFLYLVTLGYLTYNMENESVYSPTEETRRDLINTVEELNLEIYQGIYKFSNELLENILKKNGELVTSIIDKFFQRENTNNSIFTFEISRYIEKAVLLSLLATEKYYFKPIQNDQKFRDIADIVYLPKIGFKETRPTLLIKINSKPGFKRTIYKTKKEVNLPFLKKFADHALLLFIKYNTKTKSAVCKIEDIEFE